MADERKRELPLPPGTHAYILDSTKGVVKLFVGPTVINQTGQDRPVKFNTKTFTFDECASLEAALSQNVVVPEGFYAVLTNPAKDKSSGKLIYPGEGQTQSTPDLAIGLKENIPGPVSFALFPGQMCEVRRGHHLRSNEYLRIKIYNEGRAIENWSKAVIKTAETATAQTGADGKPATTETPKAEPKKDTTPSITDAVPADLAVGKQYNILGTKVAFYIPPTGVSVVPEGLGPDGKDIFVRQAETLGLNEYSILVDEDGNKEYPRGPAVVFPRPTQEFLIARKPDGTPILDDDGLPARKYKAIEINSLQGIQLKFAKDGELHYADGSKEAYKAGDEKFIKGDKMPIYYPEEGHQLVRYDGKSIHYAVAVTEGEAKYVLERATGYVKLEKGPQMLLPDPVKETIVLRPLSDREARTWFPGADGSGREAAELNAKLRTEAGNAPTTRQGVVSQGQLERGIGPETMALLNYANSSPEAFVGAAAERGGMKSARARSSSMAESRQGKDQQAVVADVAERKSTYHEPRTIILGAQKRGVPTIKVQPGYAVNVIKADGRREAVVGPKTILMEFSDTLDILRLSTGKPKNTDKLYETVYLNTHNNKVTDIIDDLETKDHVKVTAKLSYNVNFEGDASKWFTIENYVKHFCDHIRSILKGAVRKLTVEEFYGNSTAFIRDRILGVKPAPAKEGDTTHRPGLFFAENGMRVTDVEVLLVQIANPAIAGLLANSQHSIVQHNITLSLKEKELEVTKRSQEIDRLAAEAVAATEARKLELEQVKVGNLLSLELKKLDAEKEKNEEKQELQAILNALEDLKHSSELARTMKSNDAVGAQEKAAYERQAYYLGVQVDSIVKQLGAIQPGLIEALSSTGARETLIQVARSMSFHQMFGAENGVEFIQKVFANTPLKGIIEGVVGKAADLVSPNGTVQNKSLPPTQA